MRGELIFFEELFIGGDMRESEGTNFRSRQHLNEI